MEYIRKMQKRGMILLVLGIFLIIYTIFSSALDTGCCTNPLFSTCDDGINAADCCGSTTDPGYNDCVASYFYQGYTCDALPGDQSHLCADYGGNCLGIEPIEQYCEYVIPLATCINQTAFFPQPDPFNIIPVPECAEGCCICEKAGVKSYDSTDVIKNLAECEDFCRFTLVGYTVDTFDTSITEPNQCIALSQIVEFANVSGTVRDFAKPLQGATVLIQGKTAVTAADGSYKITGLTAGTGMQAKASLSGYLDNVSTINLAPGENTRNFILQSAQIGTLEGTVTSIIAPAGVDGVSVLIAGKTDRTDSNGFYQILSIPYGEYLLTAANPDYDTFTQTIIINKSLTTLGITLVPKEFAALTGTVASAVCPSDDKCYEAIGNAVVTLSGSLGTFTAVSEGREILTKGFYRISDIPATPGNTYILRASAEGFEPFTPKTITFNESGIVLNEPINLVPIVPGCGVTDCTPPLDFSVEHVLGKKEVKISWRTPCNVVAGFDIIRNDGKIIPVTASVSKTYYSINDTDVNWGQTYKYEIISYYPEGDCKQSSVTADTRAEITLGDSICQGRYDNNVRRWIGFCEGNYIRKKCNNFNKVELDDSGPDPANCSIKLPLGQNYCSGPDKYGDTYCKRALVCDLANIPPFGICQDPLLCWGANVPAQYSTNYCFKDKHPTFPQFDICRSCTTVASCFDYKSSLACELDNSTCFKANGSICKWQDTSIQNYIQGFCYPENYEGTDRCTLCNYAKSPTIGVECKEDICSLLGNCYAVEDVINIATGEKKFVTCAKCESGTTTCEDYGSAAECTGVAGIHFEGGCTVVNSKDRCGLGVCRWDNNVGCIKDGNLDGVQDCGELSCLKDTKPPTTTITQDGSHHIVISIDDDIVDFNTDESISKIEYCITANPDVCCSSNVIKTLNIPTADNIEDYLRTHNIVNLNNNTYYLKYWATDAHSNREQTKTKQITADITEPEITVYHDFEFFGIADTASLEININVNERVDCTDRLTGPGVSKSGDLGTLDIDKTKNVVYEDLHEGTYTYSITCTDKVGNSKTETKTIGILKPFITLVTPEPVTDSDGFPFRIKTLRSAVCALIGLNGDEAFVPDTDNILQIPLTGSEKLYKTKPYTVGVEISENLHHDFVEIRCVEPGPVTHEKFIEFTTDQIGPVTDFTAINFNNQQFSKDNLPAIGFDRTIKIKLTCKDRPLDDQGNEVGFKCKETKWCQANLYGDCDPSQGTLYNYGTPFDISSSKTICYQSWDNGIRQAYAGPKECVDLIVAEPLSIVLLEPIHERELDGVEAVLNIPNFNIKIKTSPEVSDCRFAISADVFDIYGYDSIEPQFIFNKIGVSALDWIYTNYPEKYKGENFSLAPGKNSDEMYIKCRLLATGEVLPDTPKHYRFIYDPTPPNITDYFATTDSRGIRSTYPLILLGIQDVYLRVDTDDKTLCKFHPTESIYERMGDRNIFGPYQEEGTYTRKHIIKIDKANLRTNLKEYKYYVACENRAGDISGTKTIKFNTNFNSERTILSADVEPILATVNGKQIINNSKYSQLGGILFTVETSHATIGCYYSNSPNFNIATYNNGSFPQLFKPGSPTTHITSNPVSIGEGNHDYRVICRFTTGEEKDAHIRFTIDKSPPTILNITISDSGDICSETHFSPEFDAEDDFSGVKEYRYQLLKVTTPITNWTTTTDENPSITGLNLTTGDTYRISVIAVDYLGQESSSKTEEFTVLDPDSFECVGDDDPPIVAVNKTFVGNMAEISLGCSDRFGCYQMNYGYSKTAANCNPNQNPYYYEIQLYDLPIYLCYNATDNNGNSLIRTEYIAINDTDSDGIDNDVDACPDTPITEIYSIELDETSPYYGCGPSEIDSDGDMLPDFWEDQYSTANCLLDSTNPDSNANGVSDADEDCDDDGKNNYFEYLNGLDPTSPDLEDEDEDGVTDDLDQCAGTPINEIADETGCSDSQKDTDGDGMDDKWEKENLLDYTDPSDAADDEDDDGLTNLQEYNLRTDPNDEDTDGDEYSDKKEVDKGFDPLDASSFPPAAPIFAIIIIIVIILLLLGGGGYLAYMYRAQIEKFVAEKIMQKPAAPARPVIPARPAPVRPIVVPGKPAGPTPEELERKRIEEIRRKRIETKMKRRGKTFEMFGAEKPKEKPKIEQRVPEEKPKKILPAIKPKEEKTLKPLAKVIKIPEKKSEFDRLAQLTEEHITKGRPIEPLLKITRIPKGKEDEFEKLTELIKGKIKMPKGKQKKKELTAEQKKKIRDVFSQLGEFASKEKSPFEELGKMPKKGKSAFEELSKLSKKSKR